MKKQVLEFFGLYKEYQNNVVPSRTLVPKWYKEIPKWLGKDPKGNLGPASMPSFGKTMKSCVPFGDTFTVGYSITLPYDLLVEDRNGSPYLTWGGPAPDLHPPIDVRSNPAGIDYLPVPHGYNATHFIWYLPAVFRAPVGYSVFFTHPVNRFDLPFQTLSGVIDGGFTVPTYSNIPFFVQEGFNGVIPQGTPIAQLIPFKNEPWEAKENPALVEEADLNKKKTILVFSGWYKSSYWRKKTYD